MGAFFQGNEWLIIFFILLLILGPSKLPALARGLGQAVREFRKAASGELELEKGLPPVSTSSPRVSPTPQAAAVAPKSNIDRETLEKIAARLGISTEGKSDEQLYSEVVSKAKEQNII